MNPEAYLEHSDWVRKLAHALVFDQSRVDDVVQATWLELLERPPATATSPRGWLRSVVRNAARQQGRAAARRSQHEERAARERGEATDITPEAVLDRAITERHIANCVLALDEPYRQTVLLRYFEGHSSAEIARQLQVPDATVRTRLRRALEQLRTHLDTEHGDRRTWSLAVLPLAVSAAPGRGGAHTTTTPLRTHLVAATLLILGAGLVWWSVTADLGSGSTPGAAEPDTAASGPEAEDAQRSDAVAGETAGVTPAGDPRAGDPRAAGESAPGDTLAASGDPRAADGESSPESTAGVARVGRVLDTSGTPVSGVTVVWFSSRELQSLHEEWELPHTFTREDLIASYMRKESATRAEIERRIAAAGLPAGVESFQELSPASTTTDADGYYSLPERPAGGRVELRHATLTVVGVHEQRHPTADALLLDLMVAERTGFRVCVSNGEGNPMRGARVQVHVPAEANPAPGWQWTIRQWSFHTGDDGCALSHNQPAIPGLTLVVSAAGHGSVTQTLDLTLQRDIQVTLLPVTGDTEGIVRGVVLDDLGRTVPGAQILWGDERVSSDATGAFAITAPADATPLGATHRGYRGAIIADADARTTPELRVVLALDAPSITGVLEVPAGADPERFLVMLDDPQWFGDVTLEGIAGGDDGLPIAVPDADGRFQFEGLLDRPYRLRAWDRDGFCLLVSEPIGAGRRDVVLGNSDDQRLPRVTGRVRDLKGRSVAGARVNLQLVTLRLGDSGYNAQSKTLTTTDAAGRFTLTDVWRHGNIVIESDSVDENAYALATADVTRELLVRVGRRYRMRVDLTSDHDAVQVLDVNGTPLPVLLHESTSRAHEKTIPLVDGRSPLMEVDDTAQSLRLLRHGQESARVRLTLQPDRVTIIRHE